MPAEERKLATVLFADLVASTELAGGQDPERVRAMLDRFYDGMTAEIERAGGTVEKFVGDAVMAVFGIPVAHEDDALRAVRAAWEMREAVAAHGLAARIGVNTGYVTVGNFGSNDRMDYTIIGNAVNLTARLQSQSEIDGILLGHETYSLVKDEVAAEEQTPIKVKGFAEPIRCYKVQGLYDHLAEEGTVIREEQEGFKFHLNLQKRDKKDAIRILEGILSRLKS